MENTLIASATSLLQTKHQGAFVEWIWEFYMGAMVLNNGSNSMVEVFPHVDSSD